MREILFKAKRLDNGEWISGSLVCFAGGARAILPSDSKTLFSKSKGFICCDTCHDVDPSTVCQYTGLKDKNGKRIFEGDILSYDCGDGDGEPREVHFMNGRFVVQWAVRGDIDDKPYQTIRMAKVVGSIHDGEGGQHEGAEHD